MSNGRRQFLFSSPTISNRGVGRFHDVSGSEFSSLNGEIQNIGDSELVCDECHYPKRHPDMTWWWDEQCTITVCEHCCMSNHRNHRLKLQNDAEREENESYKKFCMENQNLTTQIKSDVVENREMLKKVATNLCETKGLGVGVRDYVEKFETQLKRIENEIFTLKDARLTKEIYLKRIELRRNTEQIFTNIDRGLKDFVPALDKLLEQFHQLESLLKRWEREGLTSSESDGDVAATKKKSEAK